jgi:hypothetical protein
MYMLENVLMLGGLMLIGGLIVIVVGAMLIATIDFMQNGDR